MKADPVLVGRVELPFQQARKLFVAGAPNHGVLRGRARLIVADPPQDRLSCGPRRRDIARPFSPIQALESILFCDFFHGFDIAGSRDMAGVSARDAFVRRFGPSGPSPESIMRPITLIAL